MQMCKTFILAAVLILMLMTCLSPGFYSQISPLPEPRQMYGTAVVGDHLYVIGGNNANGWLTEVLKAPIKPDGSVGAWSKTRPLPINMSYIGNTTLVMNDIIYIIGANEGSQNVDMQTLFWNKPMPGGELGEWQQSPPFPGSGISCAAGISTSGHIHLIGGLTGSLAQGGKPTNVIWSAKINERGDFVGWEPGPQLPMPLWFHNAGVTGGRAWVWGGLTSPDSNSVSAAIYSAPILSDGRLGTWTRESSTLPQGFYRSACTASGKYLISFCPSYMGSVESNDIWFAEVGETGISPWSRMSTTIASKVYIGVATDFRGGCVYLPGGRKTRGEMLDALVDSVYLFKLAQEKETAASASSTAAELPASGPGRTAGQDLSYLYASERTSGISKDFVPYEMARQMTRQAQIPMVIYYHSPRASKCASQKEILDKMDLSSYKNKMIFAIVDISLFPQTAQQHGVFRVPCWIRFNGAGMVVDRKASLMTAAELTGWLGAP